MEAPALSSALRILIVDDHAIVREGLRRILEMADPQWQVVEASDGFQALELLRQQPCDVGVFDLSMPAMGGLELVRRVRADWPAMGCMILSMHAEDQYAMRSFKAGASGYVTKDVAPRDLAQAVRRVAAGGTYLSDAVAEGLVKSIHRAEAPTGHATLSNREIEVLSRLTAGQRPTDIALAMNLSVKTVSTHKSRIQDKLRLPSTAALIRYGIEQGLGNHLPQDHRPAPGGGR